MGIMDSVVPTVILLKFLLTISLCPGIVREWNERHGSRQDRGPHKIGRFTLPWDTGICTTERDNPNSHSATSDRFINIHVIVSEDISSIHTAISSL